MSDRDEWLRPGAYRVAPDVYRIPLPLPNDGLRAVNVYAFTAGDRLTLIDSGWAIPEARTELASALGSLGAGLPDVERFLVTHIHRDHYSQAVYLRREFGSKVMLGAKERPSIELTMQRGRHVMAEQVVRLRAQGAAALADLFAGRESHVPREDWELPDGWLDDGEVVDLADRRLDVVHTPGHTTGHVVFYDTDGSALFAGDHVLPTITPSIGFEPVQNPNPLGDFLHSLAVVRSRPDATLFPAHGAVAPSVHARVDELVAHHGQRLDATEKAVSDGASTGAEVAAVLTWTRRGRAFSELDAFNQFLAIGETAAHLDLLVAADRLALEIVDGVRRYSLG